MNLNKSFKGLRSFLDKKYFDAMLCSECYKKIPQGAELQINGTVFCKSCVESDATERNIIAKCYFCSKSVLDNEAVHEICENWSIESSEKLTLCQSCYEKWLRITKLKKKLWELMKWFSNFSNFVMWFVLAVITIDKNNSDSIGKVPILLTTVLGVSIVLSSPFSSLLIEKFVRWKYKKELRNEKMRLEKKLRDLKKQLREKK